MQGSVLPGRTGAVHKGELCKADFTSIIIAEISFKLCSLRPFLHAAFDLLSKATTSLIKTISYAACCSLSTNALCRSQQWVSSCAVISRTLCLSRSNACCARSTGRLGNMMPEQCSETSDTVHPHSQIEHESTQLDSCRSDGCKACRQQSAREAAERAR